jgi:hypothetical protein
MQTLLILSVIMANQYAKASLLLLQGKNETPPRCQVVAFWIDLKSHQSGEVYEPLAAPTAIVSLKDAEALNGFKVQQGNLNDKAGLSFVSEGSLRVTGTKYPYDVGFEYKFKDNRGRLLHVSSTLKLAQPRSRFAIRCKDEGAILVLMFEPILAKPKAIAPPVRQSS